MARGSVEVALPRQSPPGVSLFRCFCCYLGRPHARYGPLRYPPLPGVSRSRRIGSHLRRVAPAPARHYGSRSTETGNLLLNTKASQEAARFRGALKTVRQTRPFSNRLHCAFCSAKPMLPEPFRGSLFSQLLSRDSPRGRGDSSPPRRSRGRCVPCRSCRAQRRPGWSRPSCRSPLWPPEASLCGCR